MEKPERKVLLRVCRFLTAGSAILRPAASGSKMLLDGGAKGTIVVGSHVLTALASAGLIGRDARKLSLTEAGAAYVKRSMAEDDPFQHQHREFVTTRIDTGGKADLLAVNLAESPLAQLARRKAKNGKPFLVEEEWRAGERFRADYTRGQIMPRMGINWDAAPSSGGGAGGPGGVATLAEAALSARQRVNGAIDAVGPELSGVLIDVCCFLKGLEAVESERGWPVRSAKLMLKTALGVLSRHYSPPIRPGYRSSHALHWGTDDYRPSID